MSRPVLIERLYRHVETTPERVAVASGREEVRYGDLWSRILRAADRLSEYGVERGDRVALAASRTIEFVCGYFASHLLGVVTVPLDPKLPPALLNGLLDSIRPKVFCPARLTQQVVRPACRVLPLDGLSGDRPVCADRLNFPTPDSHADLLLTSGTTGSPKGVLLSHRNIFAAARNINEFVGNIGSDREVLALPLSHSFGLGRLRCQMLAGGTLILTEGFWPPKQLFHSITRWKATGFSFVPAAWAMLTKLTGDGLADFSSHLRYIEIGSAPIPVEEKQRLMRLFPRTRICMHYGLTEASRSAFIEFHDGKDRLDSIGKPSPNVQIRIVDPEGGDLPPGKEGMILIGGDHVATGYWTSNGVSPLETGWVRSGDLGYRAEDDFLYFRGREVDLINVGGRKVYPAEVEDALKQHESVADCACAGAPDPHGITGESVKAFLVGRPGLDPVPPAQDLVEFLSGRLEAHKIPTAFAWVAALPRNESGKVSRKMLRDWDQSDERVS